MEASRRHPVGGAARRLAEQRESTVEEQREARFTRGSEKRRQILLGIELHGDKYEWCTWTSVG
jgi:hypothetical protein